MLQLYRTPYASMALEESTLRMEDGIKARIQELQAGPDDERLLAWGNAIETEGLTFAGAGAFGEVWANNGPQKARCVSLSRLQLMCQHLSFLYYV